MKDLRDDQLPQEPDSPNVRVMGRGNVHADYKWIADGLDAVGKSQADLVRYMVKHQVAWDQPIMSRQLKGGRALKSKEEKLIHRFFAENGLIVRQEGSVPNQSLTTISDNVPTAVEGPRTSLEGKVDVTIMLVDELKQAIADLRGRVQALEQSNRSEAASEHFKPARRR